MRTMILCIVLIAAFAVGGCGVPAAVQGGIVTASQLLHRNVIDARAAEVDPWVMPDNPTPAQQIAGLTVQKDALLQIMEQASKNLAAADKYFKVNRNTPADTITPLEDLAKDGG